MVRFVREGWPVRATDDAVEDFRKLSSSLTTSYECPLYGARVVIPESLRKRILLLLHEGYFGIERMKQLARTVVFGRILIQTFQRGASNVVHVVNTSRQLLKLLYIRG